MSVAVVDPQKQLLKQTCCFLFSEHIIAKLGYFSEELSASAVLSDDEEVL